MGASQQVGAQLKGVKEAIKNWLGNQFIYVDRQLFA